MRRSRGEQLLRAGIEVATPLRDRGIDLIGYVDQPSSGATFLARPIQIKAASARAWNLDRKYGEFPGLIIAYVWCVDSSDACVTYAMSYADGLGIAQATGYAESPSWKGGGKYATSNPPATLVGLLEPHRMNANRWRSLFGLRELTSVGEFDRG